MIVLVERPWATLLLRSSCQNDWCSPVTGVREDFLLLLIVVFERLILGLHVLWLEEFGFDLSSSLSTDWIGLEISSPFPASYNTMPLDMLRCNRNDNGNSLNFYSTLCFPTRFSRKTFGQGGNSALRYLTANERTSSSICSSWPRGTVKVPQSAWPVTFLIKPNAWRIRCANLDFMCAPNLLN